MLIPKRYSMFGYDNDIFKKRFFINIQLSKKDINISTAKRQKAIDEIVATQNAMREICYGNVGKSQGVYISANGITSRFPQVPTVAFLSVDKFRPVLKNEISLLEALEFIAFGVEPTDEYGKKVSKFRPLYKTDLGSEEGQKQLKQIHIAAEILEGLFEKKLEFRKENETKYDEHIEFVPRVSITDDDTKVILTDMETGTAYDDVMINFEYFKKVYNASCEPRPNSYRLEIIDHTLYIFKNDQRHFVQNFNLQHRGTVIPQSEIVLKYCIDHPYQDISVQDIRNYTGGGRSLYVKPSSNFDNMFEYLTKPTAKNYSLKKAIKKYFFEIFEASRVRYKDVIYDFPDYLLD